MSAHTYPPDLFALVHRGTPGDVGFYRERCTGVEAILELGCGYGRLIPELAKTGARYFGLELSPALLKLARRERQKLPEKTRRRVTLRKGDMRDFAFQTTFDRVLLPHSTLYCLPNDRSVLQCLKLVHAHLAPQGELLLDAYAADAFHDRLDPGDLDGKQREYLTHVSDGRVNYWVFERTRWYRDKQRFKVIYDYEGGQGRLRSGIVEHRYLLRGQLAMLLERAGFGRVSWASDFQGRRLGKRSEHLVVRARP